MSQAYNGTRIRYHTCDEINSMQLNPIKGSSNATHECTVACIYRLEGNIIPESQTAKDSGISTCNDSLHIGILYTQYQDESKIKTICRKDTKVLQDESSRTYLDSDWKLSSQPARVLLTIIVSTK